MTALPSARSRGDVAGVLLRRVADAGVSDVGAAVSSGAGWNVDGRGGRHDGAASPAPGADCTCGEPAEPCPTCRACGAPRPSPATCLRCAETTARGLCGACAGIEALAELAGLPARLAATIAAFEATPEESAWGADPWAPAADPRREARLRALERAELREVWLERAHAEAVHSALDVEQLEGDKHEGWAYDQLRGVDGRPRRGALAVPPMSCMGHVERATRAFRLRLAKRHALRMKGATADARRLRRLCETIRLLHPEHAHEIAGIVDRAEACDSIARWHRGRARGQRERFHELSHCGQGYALIRCRNCEPQNLRDGGARGRRTRKLGCSISRACVPCRDRRANERRPIFWRARADVLGECRRRQLLRHKRHGGRWSEKDFTLTLPTALIVGRDAVERRIGILFAAWEEFRRLLSRHWRSKPRMAADPALRQGMRPQWHAAFEITPGSDGLGHPHFHVWLISPWLDQENIRRWWALALRKQGLDVEPLELIKPVLREVRCSSIVNEVYKGRHRIRVEATDPHRVAVETELAARSGVGRPHHANYIEGWSIATRGKHGMPNMSANIQARVYMALEGRRLIRCTRAFMRRGARPNVCPCCMQDSVVLNHVTGECVPALEANVVTWRSFRWFERGPPLARAGPLTVVEDRQHDTG